MGRNERMKRRAWRHAAGTALVVALLGGGLALYIYWHVSRNLLSASFIRPDGSQTPSFALEVVATPAQRAKGLMFRRELAANRGMIFVYPNEAVQHFWMKDTYVPLDIVFLNHNLTVLGALERMPILSETSRSIDLPSKFVIELAAGTVARERIVNGSKLQVGAELPSAY